MRVKGKQAVAEHFGVSVRTIGNWERSGMPGRVGREYDVVAIQVWRDRRQGRSPAMDERQGVLTSQRGKDFQDERLKKAKADLVEMEVRQRRKELVEWGQVEKMFVDRIMAVKQGLLSLARALPPQLIRCREEREMEVMISQSVHDLLEVYSRELPGAAAGAARQEEGGGSGG